MNECKHWLLWEKGYCNSCREVTHFKCAYCGKQFMYKPKSTISVVSTPTAVYGKLKEYLGVRIPLSAP